MEKYIFIKWHLRCWKASVWANTVIYSEQVALILPVVCWSHILVYLKFSTWECSASFLILGWDCNIEDFAQRPCSESDRTL